MQKEISKAIAESTAIIKADEILYKKRFNLCVLSAKYLTRMLDANVSDKQMSEIVEGYDVVLTLRKKAKCRKK